MPCEGPFCRGCVQEHVGIKRLLPDGQGTNGVMLYGDSPWLTEIADGIPFAGPSGQWLNSTLAKRGLSRSDFIIHNAMACKPPDLGWTDHPERFPDAQLAIKQCEGYTDSLIQVHKPKVIVAMGNVALKAMTGFEGIEQNNGYVIPSKYGIPVVPTFHPSGLLQGHWNLTIAWILAIARAMEIANGSYKSTSISIIEDPDPSYLQFPGHGDIQSPLMCDIETPKSLAGRNEEEAEDDPSYQIIRMGFAIQAWQGVSFSYAGDYIRRAKELIRRTRVLLFWNKNYDLPRLKASGFELHPSVQIVDAMWAWHWLYSDLPKALAFAAPFFYSGPPWKHLASQRPGYYNAMDNAVQMGVYTGVKAQLEKDGRWDRFWSHCVKVDPIYVRYGQEGVKVDVEARVPFMKAMEAEALAELVKVQELLPPRLIKKQEAFKELKYPKLSNNITKRMIQSLIRIEKVEVPASYKDGSPVINQANENMTRPKWVRYAPFNPGSRDDLLELMGELKVKPPKARGEDRESVESKYLKRLTKHPIFRHCVNYKQRSKLISTYNWPLDSKDRAHTTYGFHPSTWRSSSRNVNLGNIPKRFELAKLFRRLLIAEKGHKLIEIDRSALEAVLVGYWAKSPAYINLAKAGVHSMLVSHVIGKPVPDDLPFDELKIALKAIKKEATVEQYEGCKRCIHGSNYLLSAYGMHDEYEEFFPTEYAAQKMQDIYFGTPAGQTVRAWHKATIEEAYSKKYLDNSFQYRHYFYGPMYKFSKRDKQWNVDHEGDAKRAVAYRPQSDGAAIQREDILALEPDTDISHLLRLPTYDSLVAECPNHLVDRCIETLARQFDKPIPELCNLEGFDGRIGFEIKVGNNLADMTEVIL